MSPANLVYSVPAKNPAGLPIALSIFADRPHLRGTLRDDAEAAGFRVQQAGTLEDLLAGEAKALGEVVLIDCPRVDVAALAALSRLDMRAAHCGAQLIVSTTVEALDEVFACMDQSQPQLLVDASRAERVIALGRVLSRISAPRLRELSEEDRLTLLRLTEQVGQIAQRLDRLSLVPQGTANPDSGAVLRLESPRRPFSGQDAEGFDRLTPGEAPPLPDPRLVRRIIRQRQLRARYFDHNLFADPAWDMLLDLTAARAEGARVSVTSLCIASGVPPTTALRWIGQMTEAGLLKRVEDETDRRRAFIGLTDEAAEGMARYFAELGSAAGSLA